MPLVLQPAAERDLEAIGDYIAKDNPKRALTFVRKLRHQCQRILVAPQGYRMRPELGQGIRSCTYGAYVIFFIERNEEVRIIRVLHGAMDISSHLPDETPSKNDRPA